MDVVIIGAGGHGRVVLDILRAAGEHRPVAFLDADLRLHGSEVDGIPVLGPVNLLPKLRLQKIQHGIVAIGDNRSRELHGELLREQGFELVNAIHPTTAISRTAKFGQNVVVAPMAAICTDAQIADHVIVNTGAIVDHECLIGPAAHLTPGVRLAGRVRVGRAAFIGLGASIIQCLNIGNEAIVGAGSVVLRDVPDGVTVVGSPARPIRGPGETRIGPISAES